MQFRPLHDNVLVKRLEAAEEKVGGIIIPDTAKEKPQEGNVLAVGPGKLQDDGTRHPLGWLWGIKYSLASMLVLRSPLTVKNCWYSVSLTYWACLNKLGRTVEEGA